MTGTRARSGQSLAKVRWAFRATSCCHQARSSGLAERRGDFSAADDRCGGQLGFSGEGDRLTRATLDDVALHQRAGVEIRNHSRFSATRSATVLVPRFLPAGFDRPEPSPAPRNRAGLTERVNAVAQRDGLRNDAGDGLAMIGHDDGPAGLDLANAFAERRLEFADPDSFLARPH